MSTMNPSRNKIAAAAQSTASVIATAAVGAAVGWATVVIIEKTGAGDKFRALFDKS